MRHFFFLLCFAATLLAPALPANAAATCFAVPGITACFDAPFAAYWSANGGLPVFGYPLTGSNPERNPDLGRDVATQWTERNRLEIHPELSGPYAILLGRMGAERLAQLGRPTSTPREAGAQPGCLWFAETGHNVCDQAAGLGFKQYWTTHGLAVAGLDSYNRSLQLFGLPLTAPQPETNAAGDTVLTQWFERARFEWHPDQPAAFKVLLGLLGTELRAAGTPASRVTSLLGVEIGPVSAPIAQRLSEARPGWVRYNGVVWPQIEATRGQRNWQALQRFATDIQSVSAAGGTPLVIIRGTPSWAQQQPGIACGPIAAGALPDFASFVGELVKRYSQPPYNVHHWELGNEPDVDAGLVPPDSPFGCWGDGRDPYYGGGSYAAMLKAVYPAIKAADPQSQVVIGGLLLDCDPTNPPAGKDCLPAKFLEGVLRAGGAPAFDLVAYHAYTYWSAAQRDWDQSVAAWAPRGGLVVGKADFLRSVMARYGVVKPLLMDEGGLLCYPSAQGCPADQLQAAQANYVVRLYSRAWATGLQGAVWFTLNHPGWRDGSLLDAQQAPRPAFATLRRLSALLDRATYLGPLTGGGVEGYLFRTPSRLVRVYWTNDGSTVSLPTPPNTEQAELATGQSVAVGASLSVGFVPVIVVSRP